MENSDKNTEDNYTHPLELVTENVTDNRVSLKANINGNSKGVILPNIFDRISVKAEQIVALNLSGCHLRSLPEEFSKLIALKEINLSRNNFQAVPDCVTICETLERVDISHNKVEQMMEPNCVKRLTYLNVSDNCFRHLPIWFQKVLCFNLVEFDYSFNEMNQCVHSEFWRLSYFSLSKLLLRNSHLLPDDFPFLKTIHSLRYLDIGNTLRGGNPNLITDIDALFVKPQWADRLLELHFDNLGLNFVGDEIRCLKNLQVLHVQNNKLIYFSQGFYELKSLKVLNASNNRLDGISEQMNQLKNLEEAYLACNILQVLPDLSALDRLRIFDVYDNELKLDVSEILPKNALYDCDMNYFDGESVKGYEEIRNDLRLKTEKPNRFTACKLVSTKIDEEYDVDDQHSDLEMEESKEKEGYEWANYDLPADEEYWDDQASGDEMEISEKCLEKNDDSCYPSSDDEWALPPNYNFFPTFQPKLPPVIFHSDSLYADS